MTVYWLQSFEPPPTADAALTLPPPIQQWIAAGGASHLPPGLIPGTAPATPDPQRFHGFRVLEWQPIEDPCIKSDILNLFGHRRNFQNTPPTCLYAELGFVIAQPNTPMPAEVLVSLSCAQVEAFNFPWPYAQTGVSPDSQKKFESMAQRVFQGP